MKGFGVDPDDVRDAKLAAAPAAVEAVAEAIRAGEGGVHLVTGTQPWLKSRLINPLFRSFLAGPDSRTKYHVSDSCIGCQFSGRT